MRLFLYYALHTFKNQLKKLFKTWVLIFLLVCVVIGGLIGGGAALLAQKAEENRPQETEQALPQEDPIEEPPFEELPIEDPDEELSGPARFLQQYGLDIRVTVEAAAGLIFLLILTFMVINADKSGSKIFLPADVKLLFPSPMKPQSVLMFRLATQLGVAIVAVIYQFIQIPNLMNLGLSPWSAASLIVSFGLTVMAGTLLQSLLYTLASTHPFLKRNLRRFIYAALGAIAAAYLVYASRSGQSHLTAAVRFFGSRGARVIPFWGWIKGVSGYAMEGSTALSLLLIALTLAGTAVLLLIIHRLDADFYEEATQRADEVADLLAKAQEPNAGLVVRKRKKDRSEKLKRDGFTHGSGANVYFFKAMYNRARFSHFGVFTKTSETYLVTCAGVALLCRLAIGTRSVIPVVLAVGALAFYRTLGNPLSQDTGMDSFLLVPESNLAKLLFSLLGGSLNCLLDMIPGMIAAAVILPANPLKLIPWMLFILSVDLFGTAAGTFINLSVPVSAGKTLKQVVQVMFLYFGLLPDIAILAIGFVTGHALIATVLCAAVNVVIGLVLLAFSTLFLTAR